MKVKTVYYNDLLNDEFSGTKIKRKPLGPRFKYVHKNPFFRFFAFLFYRVVAVPLFFFVSKIGYGVKVLGKANTRSLHLKGYFVYGNHTQICDAWNPQVFVTGGKRAYIVANQDATSISGVRTLVQMLGCIPVPERPEEVPGFRECLAYRIKQKAAIIIYPERHIWPYYTHIRPFPDDSFVYPAELNVPVIAQCTTYRRRKFFKNGKPRMTIHLSSPIYPDMSLSLADRKKALRDQVYDFMVKHSAEDENIACVNYVKKAE